jgi:ribosomal protein S12 methylthiotransferase accessory factor
VSTSSSVDSKLSRARVLIIGLEPWGAVAAADLAAAGLGELHLLDDRGITDDDRSAVWLFAQLELGRDRAEALLSSLASAFPGCKVTAGALTFGADRSLVLDDPAWDLIVTGLPGDDLLASKSVARFAELVGATSIGAHLDGLEAVVGPAVAPGKTACWECCRLRRLATSRTPAVDHALHAALLAERPGVRAHTYLSPMPALVGHALALAALDLLADAGPHPLEGRLLVQDLVTMESETHTVLRMPHCDVCGGAFRHGRAAPEGNGESIGMARDAEDLRRMLAGVVDRRTGIVCHAGVRLSTPTREPEIPIAASALLSRYTDGTPRCHGCEPELGSGKGTENLSALVSAVGEAVERYSASRYDRASLLRAPVAEMKGDFLPPAALSHYAERQYQEANFPFARLCPHTPIDWVQGFWLDTRATVHVPALPAYFNYHAVPAERFCEVTSNGLAAGPTLEDAALSAALELCERDAFMISWLTRRPGKRVILDASIEANAREAVRQLEELGVRVELYLLDVGTNIPAIACVGYGDGEEWPSAMMSLAAHLRPSAAIAKAIYEQGHFGPYLCRLVAEGKTAIPARPEDVHTLEDHALYYVPKHRTPAFSFLGAAGVVAAKDLPEPSDVSTEVLVRRLAAAGLRVAIVDVTSPDLAETPFRVARALGAGFQQIHFGHGLERLGNPRLLAMATHGINPDPHPMA